LGRSDNILVAITTSQTNQMKTLLLALALSAGNIRDNYTLNEALAAIKQVETGNSSGIGVKGDGGKAWGPFQIHKAYWEDSAIPGSHRLCLESYEYSRRVVIGYMERYAAASLERLRKGEGRLTDVQTIARIHNGGPKGASSEETLSYWQKVRAVLNPPRSRVRS
jgi:hypothetical protein